MQWSNLTKCGLFFKIVSPAVHTLLIGVAAHGFPWYRRSCYPDPRKSPQLQMWPHHWFNTISQPSGGFFFFFGGGEQKIVRWCQIRRIWRVIKQFIDTVMHSRHCNHRLVCRSIVLVKQDSLCQFSKYYMYNFSKSSITYPVWVYLEGNNAFSIRKGWIFNFAHVCQVSLLWHNSFLVSLWTFQPTFVNQALLPDNWHIMCEPVMLSSLLMHLPLHFSKFCKFQPWWWPL